MRPVMRAYAGESDYWRVRAFLRDLLLRNRLRLSMWHVSRWDYWRWHVLLNCEPQPMERVVALWEADGGTLAAVLNPDNRGDAFFQVDPRHRSVALDRELLAAAEERLPAPDGRLKVWVPASDPAWSELLDSAGYRPTDDVEHVRADVLHVIGRAVAG